MWPFFFKPRISDIRNILSVNRAPKALKGRIDQTTVASEPFLDRIQSFVATEIVEKSEVLESYMMKQIGRSAIFTQCGLVGPDTVKPFLLFFCRRLGRSIPRRTQSFYIWNCLSLLGLMRLFLAGLRGISPRCRSGFFFAETAHSDRSSATRGFASAKETACFWHQRPKSGGKPAPYRRLNACLLNSSDSEHRASPSIKMAFSTSGCCTSHARIS